MGPNPLIPEKWQMFQKCLKKEISGGKVMLKSIYVLIENIDSKNEIIYYIHI